MRKEFKGILLVLAMAVLLSACGGEVNTGAMDNGKKDEDSSENGEMHNNEKIESTAENDTDLGLRFTKIDNKEFDLSEEEKIIIEYFDRDYFEISDYEFLQRYPDVFRGAQVFTSGKVEKIISSDDNNYEILFWIGFSEDKYDYWSWRSESNYSEELYDYDSYVEENKNNYVVIKGEQSDVRLIEGDFVTIRGRYDDIEDYTIDGKSYHVPVINTYRALLGEYDTWEGAVDLYTAKEIRQIAKIIFGDVTIREPYEDEAMIYSNTFMMNPWYICELDNQSNAKFGKYFFSRKMGVGRIVDSRSTEYPFLGKEVNIIREIEFAPDFEHFYMFIYDGNLEYLTVEYYDKELNKIWSREFEDTIVATYDFTKNNVYLVANNTLYIMDTATGENTYPPKFVGEKLCVRKLEDGIILFADSEYDAIIKTDLKGEMIWQCNVDSRVLWVASPQIVDDKLVVNICTSNEDIKYMIIDLETGEIRLDAKSYQ